MTYILINLISDTTGDKNDRPPTVVLVTEKDHTQIKGNSHVKCSIQNETPNGSKSSTGNPDIVLSIWNNDSCITYCVPLCVKLDFLKKNDSIYNNVFHCTPNNHRYWHR